MKQKITISKSIVFKIRDGMGQNQVSYLYFLTETSLFHEINGGPIS